MLHKRLLALLLAACLLLCPLIARAHPGATDANGGHYDHSTGEYHYHHGFPAHQHPNGVCPYRFEDRTGQSSGAPSAGSAAGARAYAAHAQPGLPFNDLIAFAACVAGGCVYVAVCAIMQAAVRRRFRPD